MKVFIAIPCMDHVPALFCQSLATLQKEGNVVVGFQIGSLIYDSRNKLAREAIRNEADFVLWLDSDMVFRPDMLRVMLEEMQEKNLDFLTGIYFRRRPPYSTVLFESVDITEGGATWKDVEEIPDELFEIGGCGFGCVLMRTDVLMSVAAQYVRMFDPMEGLGEDISFCLRARKCGYKLYCDPAISCGHVGNAVITRDYYEAFRK